jgi:hypothetical protein
LYSPASVIRMIKSRRMKCIGHLAWMGRRGRHVLLTGKRERETTRKTNTEVRWVNDVKMALR